MFFKWTGGLLILFAGSGMGVWLAWGYKKRLQTLETLRRMVYCLKGEIVYSHAPLEEAFELHRKAGKRHSWRAFYTDSRKDRQPHRRKFCKNLGKDH